MHILPIETMEDLVQVTEEIGFLPFFGSRIEGFSLEENASFDAWYQGRWHGKIVWPAWDWKGPVLQLKRLVYGKFFEKKAGFISKEWFPDFCNFRRDGYDFDAHYEDGLSSIKDKNLVEYLERAGSSLTRTIKDELNYSKDGNKGFETVITRLQMQTYVVPVNYEYSKRKSGEAFGWGNCRYDIAENYWGEELCRSAYKRTPEESRERIRNHLIKVLPAADEKEIEKFLK